MTESEGMDELRERLRRAEDDARAARYLAGGADRDTAELRAELREFRAETRAEFAEVRSEMRSEFADVRSEMRSEFADVRSEMRTFRDQNNRVLSALREDLTEGFAEMRRRFAESDEKFAAIRGLLDGQAAWNQRLGDMLGVLIQQQGDEPGDRS